MGSGVNASFDVVGFTLNLLLTMLAIYSTYINFAERRLSRVGLDALFVYLTRVLVGKARMEEIRKDKNAIKRMGIMMLLVSIGGVIATVQYVIPFIRANIH